MLFSVSPEQLKFSALQVPSNELPSSLLEVCAWY